MKEHETQRDAASAAVLALRQAMGLTQQRFAVEALKTAITTVARYETTNPPRGEVLLRLAEIARQKDLHDLSDEFRQLYIEEVMANLGFNLLVDPKKKKGYLFIRLNGQEQIEDAIDYLRKRRGNPPDEELRRQFDRALYGYRRDSTPKTAKPNRKKAASDEE